MDSTTTHPNLLIFFIFSCLLIDGLLVQVIVPIFPDVIHGSGGEDSNVSLIEPTSNFSKEFFRIDDNSAEVFTLPDVTHGSGGEDSNVSLTEPTSTFSKEFFRIDEHSAEVFTTSTIKISVLFTADDYIQVLLSPWVGNITPRIGSNLLILIGLVIIIVTSAGFIFSRTYLAYLLSRAIFGISSSILHVLGESILADRISDENGRGRALAIALFGAGVGSFVGPIMGGTMYQYIGLWAPFLVIIILTVCTICLQFWVLPPNLPTCSYSSTERKHTDVMTIFTDPYLMIPIASIFFHEIYYCVYLTALPVWMLETLGSDPTSQGVMITAFEITYCLSLIPGEKFSNVIGRWTCIVLGLSISGASAVAIPFCCNFYVLLIPSVLSGLASALMDSPVMPLLGEVADKRHGSEFDTMFGVEVSACCLGMLTGTWMTSIIVKFLGFNWVMWTTAIIYAAFIPLMFKMRNIPEKETEKKQPQIQEEKGRGDLISETTPIISS